MQKTIEGSFEEVGSRAVIWNERRNWSFAGFDVNVLRDQEGEYFGVRRDAKARVTVLDTDHDDRHLLLEARLPGQLDEAHVFLCGHDERAWFVAAIPESAAARTIQAAKDALKPQEVWDAMRAYDVPLDERDRRQTRAFVRQGEWFFIPRPELDVKQHLVHRQEGIRRGAGKPHVCQFLYWIDGVQVHVNDRFPNGLTPAQFKALPEEDQIDVWETRYRDARVFVRGSIRHPDHATISLRHWHEVIPNTETQSMAMRHVAFLD